MRQSVRDGMIRVTVDGPLSVVDWTVHALLAFTSFMSTLLQSWYGTNGSHSEEIEKLPGLRSLDLEFRGARLMKDIQKNEANAAILESLPQIVVRTNRTHFIYSNPFANALLGREVCGMLVEDWMSDLVHPDDRADTIRYFQESYHEGEPSFHSTNRILVADGGYRRVWWLSRVDHRSGHGWSVGRLGGDDE